MCVFAKNTPRIRVRKSKESGMESLKELYKIGKGPSSSHTMGPTRAARKFMESYPDAERFRAVLFGSLAHTGRGHLTDIALQSAFAPKSCEVVFDSEKGDLPHPNTFELTAIGEGGEVLGTEVWLSVGGGTVRRLGDPEKERRDVYPFANFGEILAYCEQKSIPLEQVVFEYEDEGIYDFLADVWRTMRSTIRRGLNASGVLPGRLKVERKAKKLFESVDDEEEPTALERRHLCAFAFATCEENASGGIVVTAPTCGASGILPSVLYYLSQKHGFSERRVVAALAVAGLVGVTVKQNASISGAEAGCQAEVGTATAMAAAAVCRLFGRDLGAIEYAAEIALEHQLGLTCDPVGGYVQIPCIERNAVAAIRAMSAAELSGVLAGTRKISFDTVVQTMFETGKDLSVRYRETSEGGLATVYKGCD